MFNKKLCLTILLLLAMCRLALAQDAITTATDVQGGTIATRACDTTNLPQNVWTLVLFDNAGNPCTTHASQLVGTCNPDSVWNWMMNGHLTFTTAAGYRKVRVQMQVWAGGGGGACYGGTSGPIFCDNQYYKLLKQDETYESDIPNTDLQADFSVLNYLLNPYFETPSDANYQGVWIFAKPIGRPAICRTVSYHDLGAN